MISELLTRWPDEYSFSLLLVLGLAVVAAAIPIAIVTVIQWRRVRQGEFDFELKREMLARGMSADEIDRVLAAGRG